MVNQPKEKRTVLKRSRLYLSIVLISSCLFVDAQSVKKLYETAELMFYTDRFEDAIYGYEQIQARESGYADVEYKLELCYLLTGDRDRPLDKILGFQNSYGTSDPFYNYWMGRVYAYRYMYTDAKASWDQFLRNADDPSPEMQAELTALITNAESKMEFLESKEQYRITQLGGDINTTASELSPVYNDREKELLFTSSRGSGESYRVYHARQNESGDWGEVTPVASLGNLNKESSNIEVVYEDGRLFLFRGQNGGNLYVSEERNGAWTIPTEFDTKLSSDEMSSHFFINEHEDRIIFATRSRDKGQELYEIFRDPDNGEWSKPAPFNDQINSDKDEDSPYLTPDEKTLYFSSNGHGSIGGFDVFKSEYNDRTGTWSQPVALGHPINSPDDEINFKMNHDGKSGFFSSNRLYTKGEFDIYYFTEIERVDMTGRILAMGSGNPVTGAQITFTARNIDEQFSSSSTGSGDFSNEIILNESYDIEITRNGETLMSDRLFISAEDASNGTYSKEFLVNVPDDEPDETITDAVAATDTQPRSSGESRTENNTRSQNQVEGPQFNDVEISGSDEPYSSDFQQPTNYNLGPKILAKNIYFRFGTAALMQAATPVLEEIYAIMQRSPGMIVEIGGHTDNVGSPQTNMVVSRNRALAVKGWLVRKGIADERLYIKAYGESQPLASNDDERDGRELNRRIEVRLVN